MEVYCKYYKQKEQVSYDGGNTWNDYIVDEELVTRKGGLYEYDSEDCSDLPHDYTKDYLTYVAFEDGSFTHTCAECTTPQPSHIYNFSIDGGGWQNVALDTTYTFNRGQIIRFSKDSGGDFVNLGGNLHFNGRGSLEGNIMSLLYGNFSGQTTVPYPYTSCDKAFYGFFGGGDIEYAHNLIMPTNDPVGNAYYSHMFAGCSKLKTAPVLPAKNLSQNCYNRMFIGCHSLSAITCLATNISASGCTNEWIGERLGGGGQDVAENGTFVKDANMNNWTIGLDGIPSGWTINNYSLSSRTISGTPYCVGCNRYIDVYTQTSSDSGRTWVTIDKTQTLIEENSYICPCRYKYKVRYFYGEPLTAACDTTSAITSGEINGGALVELETGNCVKFIESGACVYFTLTYLTLSDSVTSIGDRAFSNCSRLSSIIIGSGLTSIGERTFYQCNRLPSIDIPDNVTSIGNQAFANCGKLESVKIGSGVTNIGGGVFLDCSGLTSVTIGSSVTSIGDSAFNSCSGLTSITIPDSVTSIGSSAFYRCYSLTSITIPDSVTSIGSSAFNSCSGLTSITIPDSVTSIEQSTFNKCSSLTNIVIPDSVTSIGDIAFMGCSSLESITIPSGATSIGDSVLKDCGSLTGITINAATPPTLGSNAFDGTDNCPIYVPCESINDYKTANRWSGYASRIYCYFERWVNNPDGYECSGTTKMNQEKKQISYDSGSTWVDTNPLITRTGSTVLQYNSPDCGYVMYRWVDNPDGYECSGTTKMSQEKKQVSTDGGSTWSDVSPLETRIGSTVIQYDSIDCGGHIGSVKYKLTLNDSSTVSAECNTSTAITPEEISSQYSGSVVSAEIGDCVTYISFFTFAGCSGLTRVVIPNSVTEIGAYSFSACTSLTSIGIPSGVTEIGERAFEFCTSLSNIVIPDGVTNIEYSTFGLCSGLTSVTIGSGVTTIGSSVFQRCYSLTSITIPSGVTSIGDYAFWNCNGLTSVTVNATTPPTLGTRVFYGTNDCPIYVPAGSVSTYQSAWSAYAGRIQAIP